MQLLFLYCQPPGFIFQIVKDYSSEKDYSFQTQKVTIES